MNRFIPYSLRLLIFATASWVVSCSDKEVFKPVYDVPDKWQPLLERFEGEAKAHGKTIDITNLIIRDDNKLVESHCGECNSVSLDKNIQKIISINPNTVCWFTDEAMEAFIFHELGHCVLGREHDETSLPSGDPQSIMTPNDLILYEGCQYPIDGDGSCNHLDRRVYYIDELFDPSTAVPDWGN